MEGAGLEWAHAGVRARPGSSGSGTAATSSSPRSGRPDRRGCSASKVLLVGAGGLGSPAALYLAAAGVGTLGIVDFDMVELSNLQRQVIHTTDRVGTRRSSPRARTIGALNPDVTVVAHEEMLGAGNVDRIIEGYDVILDGTDTFETRYLLNDAAVAAGIPVVHASVFRFEGQLTTFVPYEGPCYRCLYPSPPPPELAPGCSVAGVLGVVPGIMGLLQANEVAQAAARRGPHARGPAAPVRCARDRVHRARACGATPPVRSAPMPRAPRGRDAGPPRPGRASRSAGAGERGDPAAPGPAAVLLPAAIADAIIAQARAEPPERGVRGDRGLGRGRPRVACRSATSPAGTTPHRRTGTAIHPDDLYRLAVAADDADEAFWAIVHSHVRSPAVPSRTDIELAPVAGRALRPRLARPGDADPATGTPSLRAWRIVGGAVHEVAGGGRVTRDRIGAGSPGSRAASSPSSAGRCWAGAATSSRPSPTRRRSVRAALVGACVVIAACGCSSRPSAASRPGARLPPDPLSGRDLATRSSAACATCSSPSPRSSAAAGWLIGHPLPFIVALVIAGVDVLETTFLLIVVTLRSDG